MRIFFTTGLGCIYNRPLMAGMKGKIRKTKISNARRTNGQNSKMQRDETEFKAASKGVVSKII